MLWCRDRLLCIEIQAVAVLEELELDDGDVDRSVAEPSEYDVQPLADRFTDEDDSLILIERVVLVAELVEYLGKRGFLFVERSTPRRGLELLELIAELGVIPVRGVGGVLEPLKIDLRLQRASFEFDGDDVGVSVDGEKVDAIADLLDRDLPSDQPKVLSKDALGTIDYPLSEVILTKPLVLQGDRF